MIYSNECNKTKKKDVLFLLRLKDVVDALLAASDNETLEPSLLRIRLAATAPLQVTGKSPKSKCVTLAYEKYHGACPPSGIPLSVR
jgi:hypothetical protein